MILHPWMPHDSFRALYAGRPCRPNFYAVYIWQKITFCAATQILSGFTELNMLLGGTVFSLIEPPGG